MDSAEPDKRSLRSDVKQSRSAVLAAARKRMAERGPEALTVVAVAQSAEFNRSTAYQHFERRGQLLRAGADACAEEVRRRFSQPRDFGEEVGFEVAGLLLRSEETRRSSGIDHFFLHGGGSGAWNE